MDIDRDIMEDTNRDICYFIYGGSYLPNRIIYQIVEELVNDIDLICLLFTCKQFYYNFRQQYKCRFKGVSLIDQSTHALNKIRDNTIHATKSFHLRSFTDIFHRSISNQLVKSNIPLFNYNNNNSHSDNSEDSIEEAVILVDQIYHKQQKNNNSDDSIETPIIMGGAGDDYNEQPLMQDLPDTIKWLAVNSSSRPLTLATGWKFPSQLEKLEYTSTINRKIEMGVLPETLTELSLRTPSETSLEEGVIPKSVTSLTLKKIEKSLEVVGDDVPVIYYHFPSHLLHLHIHFKIESPMLMFPPTLLSLSLHMPPATTDFRFPSNLVSLTLGVGRDGVSRSLNLSLLTALQTLVIRSSVPIPSDYLRLPPNLTSLVLYASTTIDSLTFFPTSLVSLETFYITIKGAVEKGEQLHDTLTHLSLQFKEAIPVGFIGPSIKTLKLGFITKELLDVALLDGTIPEGVQTLSITSYRNFGIPPTILQSINRFTWNRLNTKTENLAFPSTVGALEYFSGLPANYQIPSSLTSLSTVATRQANLLQKEYGLSTLYIYQDENNRKWLLPETVTFLSLDIPSHFDGMDETYYLYVRLDPIIYQTNVTELVLRTISRDIIHCNIQRLEDYSNNNNNNNNNSDTYDVLITDQHSLLGGIVRLSKQQPQTQQLYLNINWKKIGDPFKISVTTIPGTTNIQ
ncbi:hypothetical protein DFA_03159 [Cavenderia fasciculata]|uniref:Uncharacterized protein n=1 Tax=Cavenderia fasciculata TaxID=261658 RepID=F4PGT0_CACFS|nr:uncharacterized protein DFA_03159 [Cavenderia fasciculata]EGG24914.1 hypothetical protein DFA_03159 [Cavenderia fasciculata]|eukprot:XP_004362765.1 hypothetical protein DFA_03159 [Cavenderia fasciculata]